MGPQPEHFVLHDLPKIWGSPPSKRRYRRRGRDCWETYVQRENFISKSPEFSFILFSNFYFLVPEVLSLEENLEYLLLS